MQLAAGVTRYGRELFGEATRSAAGEMTVVDEIGIDEGIRRHVDIDIAETPYRAGEDLVELLQQRPDVAVADQRQPAILAVTGQLSPIDELAYPDRADAARRD